MGNKSQRLGIGIENRAAGHNPDAQGPERLFQSAPGSFIPNYPRPAEMMTDLQYAKFMEESYGILVEGYF